MSLLKRFNLWKEKVRKQKEEYKRILSITYVAEISKNKFRKHLVIVIPKLHISYYDYKYRKHNFFIHDDYPFGGFGHISDKVSYNVIIEEELKAMLLSDDDCLKVLGKEILLQRLYPYYKDAVFLSDEELLTYRFRDERYGKI